MPQFIFSYRSAKDYDAIADPDGLAAWGTFLNDVIAPSVVDPGWPVFEACLRYTGAGRQGRALSLVAWHQSSTSSRAAALRPASYRNSSALPRPRAGTSA
jgi:hypothetical protein